MNKVQESRHSRSSVFPFFCLSSAFRLPLVSLLEGFAFGMLLQLAVGPVCLFILNAATVHGFMAAEAGVGGVTLVDAAYITLALLGVGKMLHSPQVKLWAGTAGNLVIVFVGAFIAFATGGSSDAVPIASTGAVSATFVKTVLLTAASPLTILFWIGIFSSRISEVQEKGRNGGFAAGCVLATLVFMSAVAAVGSLLHLALPRSTLPMINLCIGLILIAIGAVRIARDAARALRSH